jgi:hypothetical protein
MRNSCFVSLFLSFATTVLIAQVPNPTPTTPPASNAQGNGKQSTSATLDEFKPSTVSMGDALEIVGSAFGDTKGKLKIGGQDAKVSVWTDKSILASVPSGISTGDAAVGVTLSDKLARRLLRQRSLLRLRSTIRAPSK